MQTRYDIEKLLYDLNIPYWSEGKNVSPGWINIRCPFCDDSSNHGGFNMETGAYNCWRCGTHSTNEALSFSCDKHIEFDRIKNQYLIKRKNRNIEKSIPNKINLPLGTGPLSQRHKDYLISRQFDPDQLEEEYKLQGTGYVGDYKFRIIIPIYFENRLVSYQGRDITGLSPIRYKACPKEQEILSLKSVLYNIDQAEKEIVVVEGVTDVWRLGKGSVATFGIGYTQAQVLLLARLFQRVFILFDGEEIAAQNRAHALANTISGLGIETEIVSLKSGDPADMKQDDANNLMKELIR